MGKGEDGVPQGLWFVSTPQGFLENCHGRNRIQDGIPYLLKRMRFFLLKQSEYFDLSSGIETHDKVPEKIRDLTGVLSSLGSDSFLEQGERNNTKGNRQG